MSTACTMDLDMHNLVEFGLDLDTWQFLLMIPQKNVACNKSGQKGGQN